MDEEDCDNDGTPLPGPLRLGKTQMPSDSQQVITPTGAHNIAVAEYMTKSNTSIRLALRLIKKAYGHEVQQQRVEGARTSEVLWNLGTNWPQSGLLPANKDEQVHLAQFVGLLMSALERFSMVSIASSPNSSDRIQLAVDLITLNEWLRIQRRRRNSSDSGNVREGRRGAKGPFWMGPNVSFPEVAVAPFAGDIVDSGIILDSYEFAALSTWLAAVLASPNCRLHS